ISGSRRCVRSWSACSSGSFACGCTGKRSSFASESETNTVMQREASAGATRVRYGVLALTVSMSILLYLDRVCISVAGDDIRDDLRLTEQQQGAVYAAFFLAYALAQVPAGWLGDRLGARRMLTFCVLAWSIATGLTALSAGLVTLLAVRL